MTRIRTIAAAVLLGLLSLVPRGHADPPLLNVPCVVDGVTDPNCRFFEDFEHGTGATVGTPPSGWTQNGPPGGAVFNSRTVTPGMNGTGHQYQHCVPTLDGSAWLDTPVNVTLTSGQTLWAEWWIEFDPTFRWAMGCAGQDCSNGRIDNSFKLFDLRLNTTDPSLGRFLWVPTGQPVTGTLNTGGTTAANTWLVMGEANFIPTGCGALGPGCHGPFSYAPNVVTTDIQPGRRYHMILEYISGYRPDGVSPSVGGFKMWMKTYLPDGTLDVDWVQTHNYSNVATCGNPTGTCQITELLAGGQGEGVGQTLAAGLCYAGSPTGGNRYWMDQIRLTTTNLTPTLDAPTAVKICKGIGCPVSGRDSGIAARRHG